MDVLRHPVLAVRGADGAEPPPPPPCRRLAAAVPWCCVGRLEPRKRLGSAVRAFLAAFASDPDAVLYLKTFVTYAGGTAEAEAVRHWLASATGTRREPACRIVVDTDVQSGEYMDALYSRADCYLSMAASEGVGLGMAQAAQCGCPVVACMYGGQGDHRRRRARGAAPPGARADRLRGKTYTWAEPDERTPPPCSGGCAGAPG